MTPHESGAILAEPDSSGVIEDAVEPIIVIAVVGGLIWFGLAIIGSRRDENGMDAQDRYYHRKAMRQQMGQAVADVAIGFMRSKQQLMRQGLTAEQAKEVSRLRAERHRDDRHAGGPWQCLTCDEAADDDVEMHRLISDDPEALVSILEAGETALAKRGIVRRPEANPFREEVEDMREQMGVPRSWSPARTSQER